MRKAIVVCLDGTSNATEIADLDVHPTNVLRTARAILPSGNLGSQVIGYFRGVGRDPYLVSGEREVAYALGFGVSDRIQQAYEFVTYNYAHDASYSHRDSDGIYFFGFSRGAYEVCSLANFIEIFGIIPKAEMHDFPAAWKYYRAPLNDRPARLKDLPKALRDRVLQGEALRFRRRLEVDHDSAGWRFGGAVPPVPEFRHPDFVGVSGYRDRPDPHVASVLEAVQSIAWTEWMGQQEISVGNRYRPLPLFFVGVWDTVGTAPHDDSHDTELPWNVTHAYHALALHEIRDPFAPILWTSACGAQVVAQTWFPGGHSDVGGGNGSVALSSHPLRWMLAKANACELGLDHAYFKSAPHYQPNSRVPLQMPITDGRALSRAAKFILKHPGALNIRVKDAMKLVMSAGSHSARLVGNSSAVNQALHLSAYRRGLGNYPVAHADAYFTAENEALKLGIDID